MYGPANNMCNHVFLFFITKQLYISDFRTAQFDCRVKPFHRKDAFEQGSSYVARAHGCAERQGRKENYQFHLVIPAHAGIQATTVACHPPWIPACAGMTVSGSQIFLREYFFYLFKFVPALRLCGEIKC